MVSRRFLVAQVSQEKTKYRAIDDMKESGVNSAYFALERLRLDDVDHIAALAARLAALSAEGEVVSIPLSDGTLMQGPLRADFRSGIRWQGRCLDLSKAYRQVPLSSGARRFAVLLVQRPCGSWAYFVGQALLFGACAAVHSFNRVSKSIHHLMIHYGSSVCGQYFDDFPLLEPCQSAAMSSRSVEHLLQSLGWRFAEGLRQRDSL